MTQQVLKRNPQSLNTTFLPVRKDLKADLPLSFRLQFASLPLYLLTVICFSIYWIPKIGLVKGFAWSLVAVFYWVLIGIEAAYFALKLDLVLEAIVDPLVNVLTGLF